MVGKVRVHVDAVPAQQHGQRHQAEGKGRQPARVVEDDVDQRQAARNHHGPEHDLADDCHVVAAAQLGRGQVLRKVKRQHTQKTQDRQRQRDGAGEQATPARDGAMAVYVAVQAVEVDPGARF